MRRDTGKFFETLDPDLLEASSVSSVPFATARYDAKARYDRMIVWNAVPTFTKLNLDML